MKKLARLNGWETLLNKNRNVKAGGERFDAIIPKPSGTRIKLDEEMNPFHTVPEMYRIVKETAYQTEALAKQAIIKDYPKSKRALNGICENIWQFIFDYILYKEEQEEELRTPAHSWHIQRKLGCDCDDMAIFAASLLYNLKIPFQFRITKYRDALTGLLKEWQHVYVIVPTQEKQANGKDYLVIDPVLNKFNYEIPFGEKHDFTIMSTYQLNGFGSPTEANMPKSSMKGETAEMIEYVASILVKVKQDTSFAQQLGYHPANLIDMCEIALSVSHDEKQFEAAIARLELAETRLNDKNGVKLQGFGALGLLGDVELYADLDEDFNGDLGSLKDKIKALANKVKAGFIKPNQRTLFPKLNVKFQPKNFFKKIGAVIKEKANGIKTKLEAKFNKPIKQLLLHAAMKIPNAVGRAGFHLFLKLNLFRVAETLRWSFLSESEASQIGVPSDRWQKSKDAYEKLKKFHYQMGGEDKVLEQVVRNHVGKQGLKGFISGYDAGLGIADPASLAAIVAALPTVAGALKIINDAGVINMFKKKQQKPAATTSHSSGKPRYNPKGVRGLNGEDGEAIPEALPSQSPTDVQADEGKKKFIARVWDMIKSFFAKKPTPDYASEEGLELEYQSTQEPSNEEGRLYSKPIEDGSDDNGTTSPASNDVSANPPNDQNASGTGSNTTLYLAGAAAAVVLYFVATSAKGTTKSELGSISNNDQQSFFKQAKTEKRFSLK